MDHLVREQHVLSQKENLNLKIYSMDNIQRKGTLATGFQVCFILMLRCW